MVPRMFLTRLEIFQIGRCGYFWCDTSSMVMDGAGFVRIAVRIDGKTADVSVPL